MGKSKKRNRTRASFDAAAAAKRRMASSCETETVRLGPHQNQTSPPPDKGSPITDDDTNGTVPSVSEIATTLRTVNYLARNLDVFLHSKNYKELRGALHPLVTERLRSYDKGIDYRAKVTAHLSHQRWSAALSALEAAKDFGQIPKQGTVQRWVRDVDGCELPALKIQLLTFILSSSKNRDARGNINDTGASKDKNGVDDDDGDENEEDINDEEGHTANHVNKHDPALALLEAQKQYNKSSKGDNSNSEKAAPEPGLKVLEGWRIPSSSIDAYTSTNDINNSLENLASLNSRIVYKERASERTPPNHYDLVLHATDPSVVLPLNLPSPSSPKVVKHDVPFVKAAFVLENVLTPFECQRLVQAASLLGYRPDHPTALSQPTGIDSCEWLVDDSVHDLIYQRVKELLPSQTSNAQLCGINRRWRFFRYGQGGVYRPHIDGSWPAGFLSKDGKSYERDEKGATRSYWTFLIYLNDDFEGGETKFYFPASGDNCGEIKSGKESTSLVARGVVPRRGSVLVFPQGNTASLLHEGSAVTMGTKYVIRTDVVYKHA